LDLSYRQIYTHLRKKIKTNPTEKRNKEFIKLLAKTNKTEKEILDKQDELNKKKSEKQKNSLGKQNEIIEEIRKELYGGNEGKALDNDIKEIRKEIYGEEKTDLKMPSNVKKPKWATTQDEADHINDDKLDELLKMAENMDYDKHMKDLECREALGLLKYEQKEGEEANDENAEQNNENVEENDKISKKEEQGEDIVKLPIIAGSKPVEHDQGWNNSVKVGENQLKNDEKIKKSVADELLKSNSAFKQIHSTQSIKKLLEREGLLVPSQSNLVISVLKERDGIHSYPYKPSVLPNLREHPGV